MAWSDSLVTTSRAYFAYLLRVWQVAGDGPGTWRASLEDPHTGERRGFADLNDLFAFLEERSRMIADETGESGASHASDLSKGA